MKITKKINKFLKKQAQLLAARAAPKLLPAARAAAPKLLPAANKVAPSTADKVGTSLMALPPLESQDKPHSHITNISVETPPPKPPEPNRSKGLSDLMPETQSQKTTKPASKPKLDKKPKDNFGRTVEGVGHALEPLGPYETPEDVASDVNEARKVAGKINSFLSNKYNKVKGL